MPIPRIDLPVSFALLFATVGANLALGQGAPLTSQVPRPQEVHTLVATLQSTTATLHQKVMACHRLAIIGTNDAVPALVAVLGDEQLGHYARYALEPMPGSAAGAALRLALDRLKGTLLVGVINSVGFRRDAAATSRLSVLLADSDEQVATAAAAALGRIGTTAAAGHLQAALAGAAGNLRMALVDACLTCADTVAAARQHREAATIFDGLIGTAFPDHIRTAAMCGAIMARGGDGVGLLLTQLRSDDRAMQAAGWRAARELPGAGATQALAAELERMPESKEVSLIQVLGDRGDKAALPAVLRAVQSRAAAVRVAALQVLPRLDDGKSLLSVLLTAATAGRSSAETEAAVAGLGKIAGPDVNAKILAALPSAPSTVGVKMIGVLAARRSEEARGALMTLAGGADRELSKAAFRALATVGRPMDLPELIRLSTSLRDDAVKVPADLAVYAVSMKVTPAEKRADAVLAALRAARDPATKCSLLRPLGAIVKATGGGAEAYATIHSALADSDREVRTAALRCLADWPDARPAGFLLETARTTSDPLHRELALQGGIRMAANVASGRDKTPLDVLEWFVQANRLVQGNAEKLMIVSGLGSLGRIEGLKMLQPYLGDPAVQTEAALAVVELAPALSNTPHAQTVKAVLEQIGKTSKDADVRRRADRAAKVLRIPR